MINGKLVAAKKYLRQVGHDEVSDEIILGLFAAIEGKRKDIYEANDFVEVYFGMGEAGHGWVQGKDSNGYQVKIWSHDPVEFPEFVMHVGDGDMRGISSLEKAQEYHRIRSGG